MRRIAATMILAVMVFAWSVPASAATWAAPGDAPLTGSLVKGGGPWLELPWTVVHAFTSGLGNIRSAERLPTGETLVACSVAQGAGGGSVQILTETGAAAWRYERSGISPWSATISPDGGTVIVVSRFEKAVVGIDRATKQEVWRYGTGGWSGDEGEVPPVGHLSDPFYAVRLADPDGAGPELGTTLICDNKGNRVVEVASEDYASGYTEASIVWSHQFPTGTRPKYAQRLSDGTTLVTTDRGIYEVSPDGAANHLFPGLLSAPVCAVRLEDGTTLIAEEQSLESSLGRALRVDQQGQIVWQYGVNNKLGLDDPGLATPRRALSGTNGSILIADQANARVLELGHALSGAGQSAAIDCGLPGARKQFTTLTASIDAPPGTDARISYSIDGGPWLTLAGTTLPADTFGTFIAYQVTFSSTRYDLTPRLLGLSISYEPAPSQPSQSAGDGTGSRPGTPRRPGRAPSAGTGTSGTMQDGGGYTMGGPISEPAVVAGRLSSQRGWAMARVGPQTITGGTPIGSAPAPPVGGLVALAAVYAAGLVSAPIHGVLLALLRRPVTTP